jgi:hypothetical protein
VAVATLVLFGLVWLGGLAWNYVSNRNDLTAEETETVLWDRTMRAGGVTCEPTQRLWPFGRHWDYRCTFDLPVFEPVLVRVDDCGVTGAAE